ncbi:hypothetical protein [Galbitalea soli]|uniref:CAP domain-containing protein n=1 Tax=Galbitalea soli TaxID=1268042 RepID=A0A7C9PMZ2_9MICO|nr:hypothetical protein [Galbitalea soli]NYJ29961.1 hypothetical protein [Galbitalea soli]
MRRNALFAAAFAVVVAIAAPTAASASFSWNTVATAPIGGGTIVIAPTTETADKPAAPIRLNSRATGDDAAATVTTAPRPGCPTDVTGPTRTAPAIHSAGGVLGTTTADIAAFAERMNAIRVANCLAPIPLANIKYDACMEKRLFWMAEDPSTDPASAWGHLGSTRSDGVPSVGCDGNLAGGAGNTGATVAQKWWDSLPHRATVYRPDFVGSTAHVCILFAATHGGLPNEPTSFVRAASRWVRC